MLRRLLCGIGAVPQTLLDHPNFEKNSAGLELFLHGVKTRWSYLVRTVGDVEEDAFEFVECAGHDLIAFLESGLPVEPIFFEEIFGSVLLG